MATLEWRCMACDRIMKPDELIKAGEGTPMCPYCQDYDVFPQRYFRCLKCGFEAEQDSFFPGMPADADPEETKESYWRVDPAYHENHHNGNDCESYHWIQIR